MLAFIAFLLIVILVIIPSAIKLGIEMLIASIKARKKFITAGIVVACIPLILIANIARESGASLSIVFFLVVLPYLIPAVLSGAGTGYFIGWIAERVTHQPRRRYCRSTVDLFESDCPTANGSTYTYTDKYSDDQIVEDPNGKIKDMIWKANNPQPKNLPSIIRR